jgi:predicted house-cleaning noncanonical NTP pyrophosphatase (MazG superfamily)
MKVIISPTRKFVTLKSLFEILSKIVVAFMLDKEDILRMRNEKAILRQIR